MAESNTNDIRFKQEQLIKLRLFFLCGQGCFSNRHEVQMFVSSTFSQQETIEKKYNADRFINRNDWRENGEFIEVQLFG